jgi:hypothetical protein
LGFRYTQGWDADQIGETTLCSWICAGLDVAERV